MNSSCLILVLLTMFTVWAQDHLPPGIERRMYCETCLATVQGLKKILNESTNVPSRTRIIKEVKKVCSTLEEKANIACKHLLNLPKPCSTKGLPDCIQIETLKEEVNPDGFTSLSPCKESHEDKFVKILLAEKEKTSEADLCYIHTMACAGMKKKHLEVEDHKFEDDLEKFLQKHSDRVRRAKPTVMKPSDETLYHKKEEL